MPSLRQFIRRWFRFNLRMLLIAVLAFAILLVGVPTGMHLWAWPDEADVHLSALRYEIDNAEWMEEPESGVGLICCCCCPEPSEPTVLYVVVVGLKDSGGNYLELSEGFAMRVFRLDQSEDMTVLCRDIDEAMTILKREHWNYYMNWGPRFAKNVQTWLQPVDEVVPVDDDPFGGSDGEDPFEF